MSLLLNTILNDIACVYVLIILFAISYLIGSIPTGYIIVKLKTGQDVRETGSGSTGATNVKRILGTKYFFIVMILDAIKGMIPVILATHYATQSAIIKIAPVFAAVAVILGHSKSIFLNFKGGKSVATGVGTVIALNWQVGLIVAAIWGAVTFFTNYVSVGSIVAVICAPILMSKFQNNISYVIYCVIGAIYIIYLHRENIMRLIKGEENKVKK